MPDEESRSEKENENVPLRTPRRWFVATMSTMVLAAVVAGCSTPATTAEASTEKIDPPRLTSGEFRLTDTINTFAGAKPLDDTPFQDAIADLPESRYVQIRDAVKGRSIDEIRDARTREGISIRELVLATLKMMQADAYYRPVLQLDPTALDQADALDAAPKSGPLAGTVILVKGNTAVNGLRNDAGSGALADQIATADSPVVARLREAGAVILGRANLSELSYNLGSKVPSGFSAMGGQTLSPAGPLTIDPEGASTGSAVAVQLGIVPLALGTETVGSIISPAARAGVVGYRSGSSHWPTRGVVPIDRQLDALGTLSRTVADARYAEQAVTGQTGTALSRGVVIADSQDQTAVFTKRLEDAGIDAVEADAGLRAAIAEADATLSDPSLLECGFAWDMNAYLEAAHGKVADLRALSAWYEAVPALAPYGFDIVAKAASSAIPPERCRRTHADAAAAVAAVEREVKRLGAQFIAGDNASTLFVVQNGGPRFLLPGPEQLVINATSSDHSADLVATAAKIVREQE